MRILKVVSAVGFVLVGALTTTVQSSENSLTKNNTLMPKAVPDVAWSWGAVDASGLQLGAAQVNRHSSTLLGLVRNNGRSTVKVNVMGVDDYLWVLQARQVGTQKWTLIQVKDSFPKLYDGENPSSYRIIELKPKQEIDPALLGLPFLGQKPSAPLPFPGTIRMYKGFEPGMAKLPPPEKPFAALPIHTFIVGLQNFDWPAKWNKTIEVRFAKTFFSDSERPSFAGALQSGSVFVAPEIVRAQTLPSPNAVLEDVKLVSGGGVFSDEPQPATITVERFVGLMKTAVPMSDEEYAMKARRGGFMHRGTFRIGDAPYRFVLGLGGVNYLVTPNGTKIRFKFERK